LLGVAKKEILMRLALVLALCSPTLAWAVGGMDDPPPKPVVTCTDGKVFDKTKGQCVDPQNSGLSRDEIYLAVRQLAYAGRYLDAQKVALTLPENDGGRLTYLGFTHRKLGNRERAMTYYQKAIDLDAGNLLARAYMGMGLVAEGKTAQARVQLHQIRAHGGTGTWPETALMNALRNGSGY
jgi:tetratricopeptide (TPR) repeat protein